MAAFGALGNLPILQITTFAALEKLQALQIATFRIFERLPALQILQRWRLLKGYEYCKLHPLGLRCFLGSRDLRISVLGV